MKRRPLACGCLFVLLFLYIGTLLFPKEYPDYTEWEGKNVTIRGTVGQKEQYEKEGKKRTIIYVEEAFFYPLETAPFMPDSEQVPYNKNKENGTVLCYLEAGEIVPEIGSAVKVKGNLKTFQEATNPGQFDAASYYQILKISFQLNQTKILLKSTEYNRIKEWLFVLQNRCAGFFDDAFFPREASVMKTMLLGQKRGADAELKELYQENGIAHILAISGLHISLLGMCLYKLLKAMGTAPCAATVVSLCVMFLYVCMTGFSVSALRALVMFCFHMLAVFFKRTYDLITAACVAAVGIVISQPLYLYHSGFLFSFGCILAIALVVPAMTTATKNKKTGEFRERQPEGIKLKFLSGLAITMSCLPLQLWFFFQMPLYSTFLNLLVIPLMGLLLPGGILFLLQAFLREVCFEYTDFLEKGIIALITGILAVYESACRLLEQLPGHLITIGRPAGWKVLGYLLLLGVLVILKEHLSLKKKWGLMLAGALILCIRLNSPWEINFLDVGQGDCIHIQSESGLNYLVDGGSLSVSEVGEYLILPYLKYKGIRELEAVFISHADSDHCNGIPALLEECKAGNLKIHTIYLTDSENQEQGDVYDEIKRTAASLGIRIDYLSAGEILRDGEMTFYCLHPATDFMANGDNENSMVLLAEYRGFRALLTGDVEGEGEAQLLFYLQQADVLSGWLSGGNDVQVFEDQERAMNLSRPVTAGRKESASLPVTLLKVSHHGSGNATGEELLKLISPRYAVISCGENNPYGHPHEDTLSRLTKAGCDIFTTPECGAVRVKVSDAGKIDISCWKNVVASD